ncbi:MAG: hypothetical protein GY940_00040, partial [bacterium]|nr:hypothetical protein [bacterium]
MNSNYYKQIPGLLIQAIIVSLLFLFPTSLQCQNQGFKFLENYSAKEYNQHPQNWSVRQDKRGMIYVGNHGCLLEFDGVSWRDIDVPNWSVRSLAVDDRGTLYVGGNNQLGLLAPDDKRKLVYQSLLEHIPTEKRNFSNIWKAHWVKDGVYFRSSKYLFRWDPAAGKMKTWNTPLRFNASFNCKGKYFIHQRDQGLLEVVDDSLQLTPNGAALKGIKIYMMAQFQANTYLLGTRGKGFYLYNYKDGSLTPFATEADEYIKQKRLYHGTRLSHSPGTFALATSLGGLVIIDSKGGVKDIFTKSAGLLDDNVRFVQEDRQGNLWLGLNNGISRIEYAPSPISFYDHRSGLSGILLSVVRDSNSKDLYVGTTNGLFLMEHQKQTFKPVEGISQSCFSLLSNGDYILAATIDGLFRLDTLNNRVSRLSQTSSYVLLPSTFDKNRLWVGTGEGLESFR